VILATSTLENSLPSRAKRRRGSLLQLRKNQPVLPVSGLFLGLGLYSYHVRELMVCWVFFSSLFVLLALLILGGVLACYAGKCVIEWASTTARATPEVALGSDDLRLKTISESSELKRLDLATRRSMHLRSSANSFEGGSPGSLGNVVRGRSHSLATSGKRTLMIVQDGQRLGS
jgi:hypothetical protein